MMNIPSLVLLLLISDLFIKSNQALSTKDTKGCNRKLLQARDGNTYKNWPVQRKLDRTGKSQYTPEVLEDRDAVKSKKSENTRNTRYYCGKDNPEEWFVKTFSKPDTDQLKYIFFSVNQNSSNELVEKNNTCVDCPKGIGKETEDFQTHRTKLETSIIEECTKCILQTENDRLIIKCTAKFQSSRECARSSKKKRTLILYVKFLQINGPEHSKKSIIQSLMDKNQCKSPNRKI